MLAANVKPALGTPLAMVAQDDYIQPYAIREVDGISVGIVGIDVAGKPRNSSRPLTTTEFEDEVSAARRAIEQLQAGGVEHIVLLTHQGYENDKRIPGTINRSATVTGCADANLLAKGSDAAQLVAEAFLDASNLADFSLQNAGGVRTPLAAGELLFDGVATMLPFTNVLVELDITGTVVIAALEDAVDNHIALGGSDGSHPYAAGLRWDLDMSQPKGSRFSNLEVRQAGSWVALEPNRSYLMVTNDFIAEGRDGYLALGDVTADGRNTNTYLLYTESLVNYLKKMGTVQRPQRADYSHQLVIDRDGNPLTY